jgi:LPS O-antigen subunit length determinant protein (WzzB/FepE family)
MILKDEDINFLNIVLAFWKDKYLILIVIFLSIILSSGYLITTEKKYQTNIKYIDYNLPPGVAKDNILKDYTKLFFSEENFNTFQNNNALDENYLSNLDIKFQEIDNIIYVNGNKFSKNKNDILINFDLIKRSIQINSRDIDKIGFIYNYANFTNKKLQINYSNQIQKSINEMPTLTIENENNKNEFLLSIFKYINFSDDYLPLEIYPPTIPQKIYPSNKITLVISTIIGSIFSFLLVITKYSIGQFRRNLNSLK